MEYFFSRAFTAECSVARTVLPVSLQALDTMLAIYMPAAPGCAQERAKSKPVSLGVGWKSGVVGGSGDFSEDLHGAPAMDQGVGEGVAQKGWGLAGFGVGEQPQESCGFITPTSSNFNPEDNKATSPTAGTKAWAGGWRPLRIETFGINIANCSSNFAVHTTTGRNFLQIYHMEWMHFKPAPRKGSPIWGLANLGAGLTGPDLGYGSSTAIG